MAGGAVFCACQVVASAGGRQVKRDRGNPNIDRSAWLRDPAIHAERSAGYLRPWYEAADTVDRS